MATATDTAEILLYGSIGEDISDRDFAREMDSLRDVDEIAVRISSGGGSVLQGLAMYENIVSARRRGQRVVTYCDAGALSMGAVVFQAGSPRLISDTGLLMVHSPFSDAGGDADELRQTADLLDKIKRQLTDIFVMRTGQPVATVSKWMAPRTETWFNAREAVAHGLADRRYTDRSAHATYAENIFAEHRVPERYKREIRGPIDAAVADIEANAKRAVKSINYSLFKMYERDVIRAAVKLTNTLGATADDLAHAAAAVDLVARQRDVPRAINW